MYGCESWTINKAECQSWCFRTLVMERTLENPLDRKEIKPVNPKRNQSWIFIGRTDGEAPILWPPAVKSRLIGKDPDAGKDWGQEEKGVTEDEMVRWHHRLNGHKFEQTPRDSEGQGSLACCSPSGLKKSDTTEQLNNHHLILISRKYKQMTKYMKKKQRDTIKNLVNGRSCQS